MVRKAFTPEQVINRRRDELLNWEIFKTLTEVKVLMEQWRREYNQKRPHSSLGYWPPTHVAITSVTLT